MPGGGRGKNEGKGKSLVVKARNQFMLISLMRSSVPALSDIYDTCRVMQYRYDTGYPHDGRADKDSYPHDGRADKDSYPHDRHNQCIMLSL